MMALTVEEMNFFAIGVSIQDAVLGKVVGGAFSFKCASREAVSILFGRGLLFFCNKEHDLVVSARRHDSASDSVITGVAP